MGEARMDAYRVLALARRNILEHGWVQGFMGAKDTGFCMMGAVRDAGYGLCGPPEEDGWTIAFRTLHELAQDDGHSAAGYWNDDPERTRGEVLQMLTRAARLHC